MIRVFDSFEAALSCPDIYPAAGTFADDEFIISIRTGKQTTVYYVLSGHVRETINRLRTQRAYYTQLIGPQAYPRRRRNATNRFKP